MTPIGLVAGEPSGDLIASRLLQGVQERIPDLVVQGIGGPALEQSGMQIWHPMAALSVFGYVDALRSLPRLIRIYNDVAKRWKLTPPALFLGVDAPDFNLRLEEKLRAQGVPTVHFVGPSIWAWRYERIHQIRRAVSHMLVLFPFEVEIYEKEGIPVTYVGHPLADAIPTEPDRAGVRESLGIDADTPVVAILPGSRSSEIRLLSPVFLQAAARFAQKEPGTCFLVPMVNQVRRQEFEAFLARYPVPNLRIIQASGIQSREQWPVSWQAMAACDVALVASGTATLETALFKRPMVISYILSGMMRRIMAFKSGQTGPSVPWVGLPNVLSREFVVPELLQEQATPDNLFRELDSLWRDESRKAHIRSQFEDLHQILRRNTAQKAGQAVVELLTCQN
ncbi:lipid-A-disaccharide synthase [Orrella marina]|uniref:Lipid-A-disaccharide synthase n=1 Tax=Orrella marina TaxID=2163011 RepID=A0A2R4XHF0_9BURK|nr:lipid-A-disaccharide synthase [Orrella marina]AWB33230.1 lipid-A-disaccharide synthase [Orrella marina]